MKGLRRPVMTAALTTSLLVVLVAVWLEAGFRREAETERFERLAALAEELAGLEAPPEENMEELARTVRERLGDSAELRFEDRRWAAQEPFLLESGDAGLVFSAPLAGGAPVLAVEPVTKPDPGGAVFLFTLASAFLFAWLLSRWALRPVARRLAALERVGERLAAGDLSARTDDPSADAIGRVARVLDRVGARLQARFDTQRELLQAVSHELRTPAARARFRLELLQEAESERERERHMTGIDRDIGALDAMVDELLLYVRFDRGQTELRLATLDVATTLEELAEDAEGFRGARALKLRGAPGPKIEADPRHFRRAIENLLLNAFRHAESRVVLAWEEVPGSTRITVEDDGPGIPPEQREHVFEPFARVDESRDRESGGAGLGLAIVRRIVVGHGGDVRATASPSGGARFVIDWPERVSTSDTNRDETKTE
ncbi:MAG: ATP-binding protein [Myxococcota bacterium]|nr:ATP-binding protein [Myxococcota bacterium]